ncbi:MAG: hypothetical protein C5B47_01540 [Verrucomicrobia bacterium]|nr:MAG: hypothetical protein C5B47_01540 [Verrucomicrobiota bacterium]
MQKDFISQLTASKKTGRSPRSPWGFGILLVFLFVGAWHLRSLLPSPPLMDPDTFEYLSPAIHSLTAGAYAPTWRNFVYPLFLTVVLRFSPHLGTISWLQHVLGLLTAGLIVLILLRSRVFLPKSKLLDWATGLIALIAAYLFLFSLSPIVMEHSIRPEVLFSLASAFTILAGLECCRRLFFKKRLDLTTAVWTVLLLIAAIGTYYVKPAWGFTMGSALLPLAFVWFQIPGQWARKAFVTLLGLLLAIALFVAPSQLLRRKDGQNVFLLTSLLCAHAEFIVDILQADALQLPPESPERATLLQFVQDIERAIHQPHYYRYGLALDPDDLTYKGPLKRLEKGLQESGKSLIRFCYYYYFRAWQQHPSAMVRKIIKQMEYFYSPKKLNIYAVNDDLGLPEMYSYSLRSLLAAGYPACAPLKEYLYELQSINKAQKVGPALPRQMQWLIRASNAMFFPIFLLSLTAAGALFFLGKAYCELRPAALLTLYYLSFNFVHCLTISVVFMMNVTRYHFNQISMSLVSEGFGILFLIALINRYFLHRKRHHTEQ